VDLGLSGKVAIVTGGSTGIGYATARSMAREGARVAICARRADVLEQAAADLREDTGGEIVPVAADVSQEADIRQLFDAVLARFEALVEEDVAAFNQTVAEAQVAAVGV